MKSYSSVPVCFLLIAISIVILNGCSHVPKPVMTKLAPLYYVPAETWKAIDEQIYRASVSAKHESVSYALIAMNNWRRQVRRHTEEVFIPWYSSYWTQQGLSTRIAWYKMQYSEGEVSPEERMADYLQNEFFEQVLEPVSDNIDPHAVMKMASMIYLRELNYHLLKLPHKYNIPVEVFEHHLKFIPAIDVPALPIYEASLYEVLNTRQLSELPAFKRLLAKINIYNEDQGQSSSKTALDRVARKAVIRLVDQLEVRSSAAVASMLVGGYVGIIISAGSATWSVTEHVGDKPEMESQMRNSLDLMLEEMWRDMVKDKHTGVTAIVHHMSNQIEYAVFSLDPAGSTLF